MTSNSKNKMKAVNGLVSSLVGILLLCSGSVYTYAVRGEFTETTIPAGINYLQYTDDTTFPDEVQILTGGAAAGDTVFLFRSFNAYGYRD